MSLYLPVRDMFPRVDNTELRTAINTYRLLA